MRGVFAILSLALYAGPALSAATAHLLDVQKVDGDVKPNGYIVKLKDGTSQDSVHSWLDSVLGPESSVTHSDWHPDVFNGFAGKSMGFYL
jgi:cerevisin